jgi:hypothetical protein
MRRRKFLTLLGGAAIACPLGARAQQPNRRPTIAFLLPSASASGPSAAFSDRLRALGWTEGRTIAIEYHWSEGRPERVAEIAAKLVQEKVNVIVTYGAAAATLKQATTSIPIVLVANDPLDTGLVASLSRPGGNVTGLSLQAPESAGKRLDLLRQLVPSLRRLAILFDATYPRPCWKRITFRPWLAILDLKSSHTGLGARRILCPFLMLSKAKLTHFTLLQILPMARASPRLHSTCGCQRPSNTLFSREPGDSCLTGQTSRFCSGAQPTLSIKFYAGQIPVSYR